MGEDVIPEQNAGYKKPPNRKRSDAKKGQTLCNVNKSTTRAATKPGICAKGEFLCNVC